MNNCSLRKSSIVQPTRSVAADTIDRPRASIRALPRRDDEAEPTLVLIHGLFSSPQEFSLVTRWLRTRKVRFELLEIDGYTRGGVEQSTWEQWVVNAKIALDRRFAIGEPIVLGGLCVGAALAAALATTPCRQSVRGLAMLSPTLRIDGWGVTRWRHLRGLTYALGIDRWISIPERQPFGIKNERMRRWVMAQLEQGDFSSIGPSRLPLWGLRQSERLFAHVLRGIRKVDIPLLVIHARDDEIASLEGVQRWMEGIGDVAQLVVLDNSYHMVTIDNDRHEVARCLAYFIGSRTAALSDVRNRPSSDSGKRTNHLKQITCLPDLPSYSNELLPICH